MTPKTNKCLAITRPCYKVSAGGHSAVNTLSNFQSLGGSVTFGRETPEDLSPPKLDKPKLIDLKDYGFSNFSRHSMQLGSLIGNIVNVVIGIYVPLGDKAGDGDLFPLCFIFKMTGHPLEVQSDLPETKDTEKSVEQVRGL